jgi:hypothetical protein
LAKRIAADVGKVWTQAHETADQEKISALVAAAEQKERGATRALTVELRAAATLTVNENALMTVARSLGDERG